MAEIYHEQQSEVWVIQDPTLIKFCWSKLKSCTVTFGCFLGCVMVSQHCTHNALVGSAWLQTWLWWIHSPWLLKGWVWRSSVDLSASTAHCPHPSRLQLAGAAVARSINQRCAPEYLLHNDWCIFMFATTLCHPANNVSWWEEEEGQGPSSWCLLASFYLLFSLSPCLWLPKITPL